MATKTKTAARKTKTAAKSKKSRPSKKALGSRAEQVMTILRKMKAAELGEIVAAAKAPKDHYKFFASTCLRMCDDGRLVRKEKDGVFVYRIAA